MNNDKKQNQKILVEENLVLPQFGCKCGLEYSTLSSLSNHIKMSHKNNAEDWKIKRGVPEGRRQRMSALLKEKIMNYIKSNETIRKDKHSENITSSQCRGIFMSNVSFIESLTEKYNLTKLQETILQKEHIKFQELWNDIDISEICNQTQSYLNSFCCVFFFDFKDIQTKHEEGEEQKEEKSDNNKSFYFYKNLLNSNKLLENKEVNQKLEKFSQSNGNSPLKAAIIGNEPFPNQINNTYTINNNNNNNNNNKLNKPQNNGYINSISNSPSNESFIVNVHPSLNFKDDQYMLNFFKNYLQQDNKQQASS